MTRERFSGGVDSGSHKPEQREQTRPIFEEEDQRRVYIHPEFSYHPDDRCILRDGKNLAHSERK